MEIVEPIEMPFGLWVGMDPGNHILDGDPDPPWEGGNFEGEMVTHSKLCQVYRLFERPL